MFQSCRGPSAAGPIRVVGTDHHIPDHHNSQMIRVPHTTDKPGGSSPLLQLEHSLGTYKQLRPSRSGSAPFARPTHNPLVPGPLPIGSSKTSTLRELWMLPSNAKRATKKTTTPAMSDAGKLLQIFGGNPTLFLED